MKLTNPTRTGLLFVLMLCPAGAIFSQQPVLPVKEKQDVMTPAETEIIPVRAAHFAAGSNMTAIKDSATRLRFVIDPDTPLPFSQSAVKQGREPAFLGPDPDVPYFTVRFAMPIPPAYTETDVAALTGMGPLVFQHNHSPGFEILPNGDALAVYFSTPAGKSEADSSTSFVQARLRYGSEDWGLPELFFKTKGYNDQSGLLWNDEGTIRFFGGGRNISDYVPFRMATSTDNGATWTWSVPQIDTPATSYTAQPVTSAFRGPDRSIYFAMDGKGAESFLWRSSDEGIRWHDMGGRTGGRHSVILPLDDRGNLLSIGGKNANVNGWSPSNVSTDWGASWSESTPSPFPPLGSAQRPSMIRLASGHLLFVSDSYLHKLKKAPPEGWEHGDNCFVAISKDNGASWHIKTLPVQIPAHHRIEHPTLGYATVRQAPNGVIHLLTTVTLPCLHYEFNEAWIWSDVGEVVPETSGGTVRAFSEQYPGGQTRSEWSARICPNGRYLLHGEQSDYYEDGTIQNRATYENGRKTGEETFWLPDGTKVWTWHRDTETNRGTWTHYWPGGTKKVESTWNLRPEARDLERPFFGCVAEGPCRQWDEQGNLVATYHFVRGDLASRDTQPAKPRIIISTDIGGTDPDDFQSMIHFLMVSDRFDTEGLISSPYGEGTKQDILELIELYEKDYPVLKQHSDGYPSPDALRAVCKQGSKEAAPFRGTSAATEGSDWIIRCAGKESNRPLRVLVWGGLEDLAQALHDAPWIRNRISVYWIGGPNKKWSVNSYAYIAENFPGLRFIEANASYRGFFSDNGVPDSLRNRSYYGNYIRGAGHLGKDFKKYYNGSIKMGDTPSLLYVMQGDPQDPEGESWGGSFEKLTHSPRFLFRRNTTLADTVSVYAITEFRFEGPDLSIPPDSACLTMIVRAGIGEQKWPGYYLGGGTYAVRYAAKQAETITYRITATIPGFPEQSGQLVVNNTWPGGPSDTDFILGSEWYTDRSDPELFDGPWQGAKTVLKWRTDVLLDWAECWSWL